jgi:hypothetical protein
MSIFLSIQERTPGIEYVVLKLNLENFFLLGGQKVCVSWKQRTILFISFLPFRMLSRCACKLCVFKVIVASMLEHVIEIYT